MALVNFSNIDFDQIKISIKDFLRSNSEFTDYDFEGSALSTVIAPRILQSCIVKVVLMCPR